MTAWIVTGIVVGALFIGSVAVYSSLLSQEMREREEREAVYDQLDRMGSKIEGEQ